MQLHKHHFISAKNKRKKKGWNEGSQIDPICTLLHDIVLIRSIIKAKMKVIFTVYL